MFSGIVEEIGRVERVTRGTGGLALTLGCRSVLEGTRLGDSIAVDGVCLTVTALSSGSFSADVQPVTARLSNLGLKRSGDAVNLERSVAAGGRIGGHYVQGHIDGTGRVAGRRREGAALIVEIALPPELRRYVVERGFIAVDGASLTVMALGAETFSVSLVQHTQAHSTLADLALGAPVNLEVDIIAKYVERLLGQERAGGLSLETLRRAGFV